MIKKFFRCAFRGFVFHRLISWRYDGKTGMYVHRIRTWVFWGAIWRTRTNRFRLKDGMSKAEFVAGWNKLIKNRVRL